MFISGHNINAGPMAQGKEYSCQGELTWKNFGMKSFEESDKIAV